MSIPGDAVRNSTTRRSFNSNPRNSVSDQAAEALDDDNNRQSDRINNLTSHEESDYGKDEKKPLIKESDSINEEDIKFLKRDGLKPIHFAAYAVGHVYNDLCAT